MGRINSWKTLNGEHYVLIVAKCFYLFFQSFKSLSFNKHDKKDLNLQKTLTINFNAAWFTSTFVMKCNVMCYINKIAFATIKYGRLKADRVPYGSMQLCQFLLIICGYIFPCSPDLVSAFKDVTLDSIKVAGATPSPAASAPPPPPAAAAPAPPAAPGSSYPAHLKVSELSHKQVRSESCRFVI